MTLPSVRSAVYITSFSVQKVARPSGTNLQLAVNSHKFIAVHVARGTLMYLNLTVMN